MENRKPSTAQVLKFAIPSLMGALLFLVPMKVGGKYVLGVSILCDIIQGWMNPIVNQLAILFLSIAVVLPIINMICKPKFIQENKTMRSLFDISPLILAVRIIGLIYVICYLYKIGPEMIWNEATGGEAYYIVTTILTLMVGTSFLISLLTDFGIMDYVGIMVRKLMKPLFTLPGRASLDCIASWVGSSLTGALLTSTQYKDGYYTKRESCVIMTCFSTAAFSFIFVLARVCGLEEFFLPSVLVIYAAVIPCAIILPRVYPLNKAKDEYSTNIGSILLKTYGQDVRNRAKARAAAGSDARMNGCELPVIINSGSGNQGITVSVPVIEYAKELQVGHEKLLRALVISNLTAIHEKTGIGTLSAYCGAVSAGAAAGAGIAYLDNGTYEAVIHTVVNALAVVSGIVCDGAKASCAAKIASSVDAGILGYHMFLNNQEFKSGDGIVMKGIEPTITGIGRIGKDGMRETNEEIIRLMINQ